MIMIKETKKKENKKKKSVKQINHSRAINNLSNQSLQNDKKTNKLIKTQFLCYDNSKMTTMKSTYKININ